MTDFLPTDFLRGADGRELDRIHLVGLAAIGYHGVLPSERRTGQTFGADVVVHVDTRAAVARDDLSLTVDYGDLAARIHAVLVGDPVDLLETLAQRIADVALAVPGVEVVDVVVHKPYAPIPVAFDDVHVAIRRHRPVGEAAPDEPAGPGAVVHPLDARPASETAVVLALGGNVGDVRRTLRAAIADLDARPGLRITAVSPLACTAAVGPDQDDYLNAVVIGLTTLSPRELLAATTAVENAHGRVRAERWGPRTLDIDVIAIDGVLSADPLLELPHPRAHERAFVLVPWAHLDPDAEVPGPAGGAVAALAEVAPDRAGVRWLAFDWLDGAPEAPLDATPESRP